MPIHDTICRECGHQELDVLHKIDEEVACQKCGKLLEMMPSLFSFTMTPGTISKFKRKIGKTVPTDYKTSGGANIYGVPRKS